MQRKRIAVAAVAVAATGAAVAFTLPSMAGTAPRGTAPRAAADGLSPQVLAAMKRGLGVDGDQAQARLDRSKWAGRVVSTLSAQTGDDFGGAWLADNGMTLKVAVTDQDAAKKVTAAGGQAVLVKRSEQQLDAAKEKLDAAKADADSLTGWFVSPSTNKVVIQTPPGNTDAAWAFAAEAGLDRGDVAVVAAPRAKPLAEIGGGDPFIIDEQARCSVGFAVTINDGGQGFVTAGHCGQPGADINELDGQQLGESEGEITESVFPGDADMGVVQTDANDVVQPVVDVNGQDLPIVGSEEAPVGATVCRSGSTTGTDCGVIQAKNQTVVYPEGAVSGLTQTDVCAEGGDSGGPFFTPDGQAQGVTSGGSGDCRVGGITFFQPIGEILEENNLTLLVAGGQGADAQGNNPGGQGAVADDQAAGDQGADDQAAAACPQLPVQLQGAVNDQGVGAFLPGNGAFRARGGRQSACVQGPAGSAFDLILQRRSPLRGSFKTVATATGAGNVKQLTFEGRAGTYRYVVVSKSGEGAYTLNLATP